VARKIAWSDPAIEDLEAAVEFIAKDSEAYARTLAQLAVDAAESLAEFPSRGHKLRDPQLSHFRELILGSYRLARHSTGPHGENNRAESLRS